MRLTGGQLRLEFALDGVANLRDQVRQAIEAVGAEIHFLPPCRPDFCATENAFSKFKSLPLRAGERLVGALQQTIMRLAETFAPTE